MKSATKTRLALVAMLVVQLGAARVSDAEVCRFAGTTNPAGHIAVVTDVTATNGITRVDVTAVFDLTTMFWIPIHYLVEEVSYWKAGELESVAVNTRYLIGDHIVRQLWDKFQRNADGLHAQRVQAKTLDDLQIKHPGFVQYRDPATFGQSWLQDYQSGSPERRADLDLKDAPLPPHLRSPLALAFYWIRWLPSNGQDVAVFLPGFKKDRLVHLRLSGTSAAEGMLWQTPLRYPALRDNPISTARAWTSSNGYLLRLAFDVHSTRGSGHGSIDQKGCQGVSIMPGRPR